MAKKSMVARDVKRSKLADKLGNKRKALKGIVSNQDTDMDETWEAMLALQKLPRDSSKSRQRNRCSLSGRPRGYFRRFGLGRNKLRELIMRGEAPGVVKSSW